MNYQNTSYLVFTCLGVISLIIPCMLFHLAYAGIKKGDTKETHKSGVFESHQKINLEKFVVIHNLGIKPTTVVVRDINQEAQIVYISDMNERTFSVYRQKRSSDDVDVKLIWTIK